MILFYTVVSISVLNCTIAILNHNWHSFCGWGIATFYLIYFVNKIAKAV